MSFLDDLLKLLIRFRPTPQSLRVLGQTIWTIANNGWQAFVWGNVSAGQVDLRDQSLTMKVLVRLALLLVIVLIVGLLFNGIWRAISPLVPLIQPAAELTRPFAPRLLIPFTYALLAVAWGYLLNGTLRILWPVKLTLLGVYIIFTLISISSSLSLLDAPSAILLVLNLASLGGVILFVLLRGLFKERLGLDFTLLLVLVSINLGTAFLNGWHSEQIFQLSQSITAVQLTFGLSLLSTFLIPFLVMAGTEVADLANDITGAVSRFLQRNEFPVSIWTVALILFLLIRLWRMALVPLLAGDQLPFAWGGLIAILLLAGIYLLVRKRTPGEGLPGWLVFAASTILYMSLIIFNILSGVFAIALAALIQIGNLGAAEDRAMSILNALSQAMISSNEYLLGLGAIALGLVLLWRARRQGADWRMPSLAVYAWIAATWLIWWVATRQHARLGALTFTFGSVDAWATLLALILLLANLARRQLTPDNLLHITALAVLSLALSLQDFLADPLSPAFGLLGAQALLVSVGLFLNVMASGSRFSLNDDSRFFPRRSRVFLYFGYAILTVATSNWFLATHQFVQIDLIEQVTRNGFIAIGLPLAYYAIIVGSPKVLALEPLP